MPVAGFRRPPGLCDHRTIRCQAGYAGDNGFFQVPHSEISAPHIESAMAMDAAGNDRDKDGR